MIGKPITGRSFGGCIRYLVNRPEADILDGDGVRIQSAASITQDFNQQRKLNPGLGKAVGHTILSWSQEDKAKLSDEIMVAVAKQYMEKMGITDTQYLIVRHHDREHPHLHIVYNRVNNRGKTISDQNNYKRNVTACRTLTKQYGYFIAPGKDQVKRQQLKGVDKLRYQIYDAVKEVLNHAGSWPEFEFQLQRKDIALIRKFKGNSDEVQGISFSKDGITFKASAIDRSMSFAHLDKQLRQQNATAKVSFRSGDDDFSQLKDQKKGESFKPQTGEEGRAAKTVLDILFDPVANTYQYDPIAAAAKKKKKRKLKW